MKYTKGDIAKAVLITLAVTGVAVSVVMFPGLSLLLKYLPKDKGARNINRSLRYLNEKKYVRTYIKNGREHVEITEKGRARVLSYEFDEMIIKPSKKWDKKWRVVTFDIPEKRRRTREVLHFKLKEMGFYPAQKSIFVIPYECEDEIEFIKNYLYLNNRLMYMLAEKISDEAKIRKHFKLSA